MKLIVIVQARLGSKRLPAKTLLNIGGLTVIERVLNFCKSLNHVDEVIVATTDKTEDDELEKFLRMRDVSVFRGDEADVLSRFFHCAVQAKADGVIRVTADDPLKDKFLTNDMILFFLNNAKKFDYVANNLKHRYPEGHDIEIFTFNALRAAHLAARRPSDREHVTSFIWNNPKKFKIFNFECQKDYSDIRITLDHFDDFKFLCKLVDLLEDLDPTASNIRNTIDNNPILQRLRVEQPRNLSFNKQRSKESVEK